MLEYVPLTESNRDVLYLRYLQIVSCKLQNAANLNDIMMISDVPEGIEGACTGTPNFHDSHLLYAIGNDLCLTASSQTICRSCFTGWKLMLAGNF
eukprot:scaffold175151_cov18-Tisochrysis_lutea.AAC.1